MKRFTKLLSAALCAALCVISCAAGLAGCTKIQPKPYEKGEYEKEISELSEVKGETLVAKKPLVKWNGRYEYVKESSAKIDGTVGGAVMLYNTATGFTVTFKGTSLTVTFLHSASDIYYNFAVDDETLPNPAAGKRFYLPDGETVSRVTLVSGLKDGEHTVTCLKTDEAADAYTAVSAFETDGKFAYRNVAEDNDTLKFMFVCASGGSGHGSLYYSETATAGRVGRTRKNSSSLHSFNYLTARMFDADVQFVAQSGWGVRYPKSMYEVLDYSGITPGNTVSEAKTTALWDRTNYIPDVIILNIGGNDTTASGFEKEIYQQYCGLTVKKLHENYPNATIIWTHTGSKAGTYAAQAFAADAELSEADFLHECVIPQKGYGVTGRGTYGANDHNSIKTHIDTAAVLSAYLKKLGYYPVRENVTFESQKSFLEFDAGVTGETPYAGTEELYCYPLKG